MTADLVVVMAYLAVVILIGLRFSGAKTVQDYFLGNRSIPWLVACFSIVATETSTLTFISVPGLAYVQGMGFLQIALGYMAGRVLVATLLIPRYFEGRFETVYAFIQNRFDVGSRRIMSGIFHVTRLLADSVRLFATAIPLSVITRWDLRISILVIGAATLAYTYYGGLRSVAVVDSVQLALYLTCAVTGFFLIASQMGVSVQTLFSQIPRADLKILFTGFEPDSPGVLKSYNIFSGLIGGAFLSFASHGTDHLLVQRVLACRNKRSAQKAMIASGVVVGFQFFLFLLLGLFIKALLGGQHFVRSDAVMPYFIVNHIPAGLRGLMLAGIFAAAMSTLSSSINSLSSSTAVDLFGIGERGLSDRKQVALSRLFSIVWAGVIVGVSLLLRNTTSPLVEVGLSIASVTFGGMTGIFLLGRFFEGLDSRAAISGVMISIAVNVFVVFGTSIFWLWTVVIGCAVSFGSALLLNVALRRKA